MEHGFWRIFNRIHVHTAFPLLALEFNRISASGAVGHHAIEHSHATFSCLHTEPRQPPERRTVGHVVSHRLPLAAPCQSLLTPIKTTDPNNVTHSFHLFPSPDTQLFSSEAFDLQNLNLASYACGIHQYDKNPASQHIHHLPPSASRFQQSHPTSQLIVYGSVNP